MHRLQRVNILVSQTTKKTGAVSDYNVQYGLLWRLEIEIVAQGILVFLGPQVSPEGPRQGSCILWHLSSFTVS